jgi:hypothetical protein
MLTICSDLGVLRERGYGGGSLLSGGDAAQPGGEEVDGRLSSHGAIHGSQT